jgi:hypothetical protein
MKSQKKKHNFKVLISDGFLNCEYSFSLGKDTSIQDIAEAIFKKYQVKPTKCIFKNFSNEENSSGMEL